MNEIMAHHDSAKKRIRQTERRTERNRARMSRVRTFFKKVELAISSGDKDAARQALIEAQPEIHRGVTRGVIHRNTAARKLSRLSARVKAFRTKMDLFLLSFPSRPSFPVLPFRRRSQTSEERKSGSQRTRSRSAGHCVCQRARPSSLA